MNCPKCNAVLPSNAISCPYCLCRFGTLYYPDDEAEEKLGYLIPINATLLSIIAGYMGIFSILVVPAPIALILGIIALRDIKKRRAQGKKIGGRGRAIFAVVMGILSPIVFVLFIIFANM